MAKDKKSFVAYSDWQDTFNALPDDKAGQLIKHLFAYVNDENPVTDDILINAVFANIKQQLKRDLKKWESISKQRVEYGRIGGLKSAQAKASKSKHKLPNASKPKQNQHDTVTVNVNDTVNEEEDLVKKCWDKWKKYKKDEFGFKYKSDVSEQAAKSELLNLSNSNIEIAIKIIDQSIANGWKGFFKLKTDGRNKQPGASNEAVARIIAEEFGNDSNK